MYNEQTNFSIKNVIMQFLFVALFVFILIWLFPLKSDVKKAMEGTSSTDLSVLTDRIFNENIISMKEAAKSYYTTSRLPKNVGDKVKMTLGEMLNKKIILPFTDKNGDACDLADSYVEITKYDEEFIMKVNLKCGNEENYLLVYMGCYDYCSTTLCEKNKSDVSSPTIYSPNKTDNVVVVKPIVKPTTPTPTPVPEKEYLYEYNKTTEGYYKESDWSEWSITEVTASSNTAVRVKTVTEQKLIGYKVKKAYDYNKPIYGSQQILSGYSEKKVCKKYDYVPTGEYTITYGDWQYVETVYLTYSPSSSDTVQYIKSDENSYICTENCSSGTTTAYKKYVRVSNGKTPVTEYKCVEEGTEKVPNYTTIQVITGYEIYVVSKKPVYETVDKKYYSFKTRTYIEGTTDVKWSSYNDTTLLTAGYEYTGNKKEK